MERILGPTLSVQSLERRRRDAALRGISTTRAGTLLKHQIPVRTFSDWDDAQPGFFEIDLVAHCGGNVEGAFLLSSPRRTASRPGSTSTHRQRAYDAGHHTCPALRAS